MAELWHPTPAQRGIMIADALEAMAAGHLQDERLNRARMMGWRHGFALGVKAMHERAVARVEHDAKQARRLVLAALLTGFVGGWLTAAVAF